MPIIATNMRETHESARMTRFEPVQNLTATDVQQAIEQSTSIPTTFVPVFVNVAASPYTILVGQSYLEVDTSGGPVTIVMPAGAARVGSTITIKDITGNAAANPISVTFNGAETADGLAPYLIDSNFGAARFSGKAAGGYFLDA